MKYHLLLFLKYYLVLLLSCCVMTALFAGNAHGNTLQQEGKAILTGQVSDEQGTVPGATVRVKDTNIGTSTDLDGNFLLQNVPVGKTVIVISFIGYDSHEQEVNVKPGTNGMGAIALKPASVQLKEVVVSGEMAPSQMKAYNMKLNAIAITDILASDAIGKLPDRNAAEAVQRISGVAVARYHGEADRATVRGTPFSWTSTLFNGTRLPSSDVAAGRSAVLDVIPSELIEFVQVSKALTPDMEADAIGGSINFITRTAPAKRTLGISAAAGYNDLAQKSVYNFSAVYGDRFFNKKLGVVLAASTWKRHWGTDEYTVDFNTALSDPVLQTSVKSLMLKRYMGSRTTNGLNAGVEYAFNPGQKIYIRGLYDTFVDERPVYESYFLYNDNKYQYNYRESKYNTLLYGGEAGGKHDLGSRLKLDWALSDYYTSYKINSLPSNLDTKYRGLPILTFKQDNANFGELYTYIDGKKYKFSNMDSPDGKGDSPDEIQAHSTIALSDASLGVTQMVLMRIINIEEDRVAQVNLNFQANEHFSMKIGSKFRNKEKEYEYLTKVYVPSGSAPTLGSMERGSFPNAGNFFDHAEINYKDYVMTPPSSGAMENIFGSAVAGNGYKYASSKSDSTNIYTGHENVWANYVMAVWDINPKVKLYGGVRNEYTQTTLNGNGYDAASNSLSPSTIKNNYNAVLPMLHVKYSPGTFTNLRAAYTTSFIRPLFSDITPAEIVNTTGSTKTVTRGNADIRPTFAYNFDLMAEHFFGNIGLVSAGVFYKVIEDLIYSSKSYETIGEELFYVSESRNLDTNAQLAGVELAFNRRFDMLPGFLKGFGLEANYTGIWSQTEVPVYLGSETETVKTQLPNQSKHLFNVVLYYELKGLTVKLAGNYRGKSLEGFYQTLPTDLWTWMDKNFTIDMAASYAFGKDKKFRIFVEVQNLTNEPVRMYLGDKQRTKDIEWSSIRGQAGIRWNIF